MVPILAIGVLIGLPIHRPRNGRQTALRKAFGRPRPQPIMHDKELMIFIEIGLGRARDRAAIETGYYLRGFLDAEGDKPVAQIA
jgi:hypothetical protein